jgi:hypothetical protein
MPDLNIFLQETVEGYLLEDLNTMKLASPRPGKQAGGVGYPLLMTTFAGIELLGALLSSDTFDKEKGAQYFGDFWRNYLYPTDSGRAAAGNTLYHLVRHGLAHVYVTKGNIVVFKHQPKMHLVISNESFCVDAAQLAEDLEHCYKTKVKALIVASTASATIRLNEMATAYQIQAAKHLPQLQLPTASSPAFVTTTASKSTLS